MTKEEFLKILPCYIGQHGLIIWAGRETSTILIGVDRDIALFKEPSVFPNATVRLKISKFKLLLRPVESMTQEEITALITTFNVDLICDGDCLIFDSFITIDHASQVINHLRSIGINVDNIPEEYAIDKTKI